VRRIEWSDCGKIRTVQASAIPRNVAAGRRRLVYRKLG
jgi:hypothetical protein